MKFLSYSNGGNPGLAIETGNGFRGLSSDQSGFPGSLESLVKAGGHGLAAAAATLAKGAPVDPAKVTYAVPFPSSGKVICVGLNYVDHSAESGFKVPDYPTLFARFNTSLIAHGAAIIRPHVSEQLDYEGELVAVIGTGGKNIPLAKALDHVAGYSVFNDASIRDYQFKAPQWTPGKNFDDTGAFGPYFVTADALPPGCAGLKLETRLNGELVQSANIDDMVFSVAQLVSIISEAMTLEAGDVIVTGTPAGVGLARKPPLWMKHGDVCEVEIEQVGLLSNPIRDEAGASRAAA